MSSITSTITAQSYYSNQVRQLLHIKSPGSKTPRDLNQEEEEEIVEDCPGPDYVKLNTVNYCKMKRKNRKETVV